MIQSGSEQKHRGSNPFASYLDHDHRERENVRLFAMFPFLFQDLWCSPSRSVAVITRGAPYRIQILSDPSKTKIRDPRAARGIHKDIWLDTCQYGGNAGLEQPRTPLRSP